MFKILICYKGRNFIQTKSCKTRNMIIRIKKVSVYQVQLDPGAQMMDWELYLLLSSHSSYHCAGFTL